MEAQFAVPMSVLRDLRGLVVIDEVQHAPDLFKVLGVLIDRDDAPAKFLLLGSASPSLLRQTSESLAERIEVIEIGGLTLDEVGADRQGLLWWRGGHPPSFTAQSDAASRQWRRDFMRTVAERDSRQLGINVAVPAILRFWAMLAHFHGQTWNAADPARSLGVNESTVRRYLDRLTQLYMVRQLQLLFKDGQRIGVEFKRMDAPRLTPSMRIAIQDLRLERLYVVYPGTRRYAITERVEAVPLAALLPPA